MNDPPPPSAVVACEKSTYWEILKSTVLVGGSSVVSIGMGVIRTKAMAVLLGPAGFGLAGLYTSIANLTQNIAGMGLNSSGVRQIAEAVASDDKERMARTATVLRRTSVLLGALGAAVLIVFCRQVSTLTFGTGQDATEVALLSLVVLLNLVAAGQGALIQGLRRISDLAQMGVLGALYGTVVTIPIVYVLRRRGIVPSLIAVAGLSLLTSWWYCRKVQIPTNSIVASEGIQEARALLKLGFAFMASGLMAMGSAYLVRITVLHKLGLAATGMYQSAWTLGGLYVSFILQAMGADFYPRLTANAHDNAKCNRLVNEQTRVSLLLAGPGVIATLTFAPFVIELFYSGKFAAATGILRWICLGGALQAITWPMGFIIIAKGEQAIFFWCEVAWAAVSVALAWVCIGWLGTIGSGVAFFGAYVFHLFLIYPVGHRLSGFTWSAENKKTGLLFLLLTGAVFGGHYVLMPLVAAGLGMVAALLSVVYSIRVLAKLVPSGSIPQPIRRLLVAFRLEFES